MPKSETRKILITGGAGFIGYHLAEELSNKKENRVILVDNFRRGREDKNIKTLLSKVNVRFIKGDLTDRKLYDKLGRDYDEVYHLAAVIGVKNVLEQPKDVLKINTLSTLYLLDWFVNGGGEKFLFSSTSEAYAWTQKFKELPVPTPEQVPLSLTDLRNPRSTYAGSKIFGELAVNQYCSLHNKPFVIVRYHNVYGPRMGKEHVISELCLKILQKQNPLNVFSVNHRRAFCYVDDAIKATINAMRSKKADSATINIGNDTEEVFIGDLARRIMKSIGIILPIEPQQAENDPIRRRCPDITTARNLLDFKPDVSLEQGLARTIKWYMAYYSNS
jgi:UDP-glucose 4-epimerase/UDP-glucuronate decarboxylase